jgi:hypothetical protein
MSATSEALNPHRLDIVDLPRDVENCLGGLRTALCATFNYCRQYPKKLDTFITVLEYVLERAKDFTNGAVEEAIKAQQEAAKAAADAVVAELEAARKAKLTEQVEAVKTLAKGIIVGAQEQTVLEDLKQYVIVEGFTPEGENLEAIKAAFVKAKTAQLFAQIAEIKQEKE